MNPIARDPRLLVFYDSDCGTCSRSARVLRWLDRDGHLHLVPLQAAGGLVDAPALGVPLDAIRVRDMHGEWSVGDRLSGLLGDAVCQIEPRTP